MIARGTLARYIRAGTIFIETGTREGNTLAWAKELGATCLSCEVNPGLHAQAAKRFHGEEGVTLYNLDSPAFLERVLENVKKRAVFWLDAHGARSPLMDELAVIARQPIKDHTILVDDVRLLRNGRWGISLSEVVQALMVINRRYVLSTEDGYEPADILVARVYG